MITTIVTINFIKSCLQYTVDFENFIKETWVHIYNIYIPKSFVKFSEAEDFYNSEVLNFTNRTVFEQSILAMTKGFAKQ